MEFLIEIIALYIFQIPGAAVRWLFCLGRRPYKDILKNGNGYLNGVIGGVVICGLITLVKNNL
jgi:hypothetical protein